MNRTASGSAPPVAVHLSAARARGQPPTPFLVTLRNLTS
jgi:hypothetical protein